MNILTYILNSSKQVIQTNTEDTKKPKDSTDIIWQTSYWNELLLVTGYIEKGYYLESNGSHAWIQKRSIGGGQYGLFCIGGPIGQDTQIFEDMKNLCKQERTIFIQIESTKDTPLAMKEGYWKKFIEPTTGIIDLQKSEEEILKEMKSKGRYNIKVAKKHEVEIEKVRYDDTDLTSKEAYGEIFFKLLKQTTNRNNFSQNDDSYYRYLCQILERRDIGGLYIAKKGEQIIAGSIASFTGEKALYYYGASTSDNTLRKYMATYLLQWKMIQEAKNRGCKTYDFLGMADSTGNPKHLSGVTSFKEKFGPTLTTNPNAVIHVEKSFQYKALQIIRYIKNLRK